MMDPLVFSEVTRVTLKAENLQKNPPTEEEI